MGSIYNNNIGLNSSITSNQSDVINVSVAGNDVSGNLVAVEGYVWLATQSGSNKVQVSDGVGGFTWQDFSGMGATGMGATGQAATITVGTVSSGITASVINTGTSQSAVFNFTLPQGPTGSVGATGSLTYSTIEASIATSSTAYSYLTDLASWNIEGIYTATALSSTYKGQFTHNSDYFFFMVGDNIPIRMPRA